MKFWKKLILVAIVAGLVYLIANYHFIFIDTSVKVLRKSEPTLDYTFYSANGKTNETVLSIDDLRRDGIADLLMEAGRLTEERKEYLMKKYVKD